MLVGEDNMARQAVSLPKHYDFLRRLEEIDRLQEEQLPRNTTGPAARLRPKGGTLRAVKQFLVGFLHLLRGPRLQHHVLGVHDGVIQLAAAKERAVLDLTIIRVGWIRSYRSMSGALRWRQDVIPEICLPRRIRRGRKYRNCILGRGGR